MSDLASSPLQVIYDMANKNPKEGIVPLFIEVPVNEDLAPFLVSRARSGSEMTLWVDRVRGGRVKAALREVPNLFDFFLEVVHRIQERGHHEEWGNVHPLSKEGIGSAIGHLKDHGFSESDLEILAHPDMPWQAIEPSWKGDSDKGLVLSLMGLAVQPTPWLDKDTLVVLPRDREMVGFVFLTQQKVASVVHNASRGVALATSRITEGSE